MHCTLNGIYRCMQHMHTCTYTHAVSISDGYEHNKIIILYMTEILKFLKFQQLLKQYCQVYGGGGGGGGGGGAGSMFVG